MTRRPDSGFTLIELMISLGLFALIAVAGLGMVDGILRVQGRTEVRLDRLAGLQRTMSIVSSDLDQIAQGRLAGEGAQLSFTRAAPGAGGPAVVVRYLLAGDVLVRQAGAGAAAAAARHCAGALALLERRLDRQMAASDADADRWPRAVALELRTGEGALRRVVVLPVRPDEPAAPR
ncbi:MAG: prepilin-type N-terminal cleavage/methylation domain-containing protein [Sphingomonas sp.]